VSGLLLVLTLAVVGSGCARLDHVVAEETAQEISDDANVVRVQVDDTPDAARAALREVLTDRGISIETETSTSWRTAPTSIGQETLLAMAISFGEQGERTAVTLRGEWGLTRTMAAGLSGGAASGAADRATTREARWTYGRPKRAFGVVAKIAGEAFPASTITYTQE
jgi:hypothetical protein